jgi:hypothetical protein
MAKITTVRGELWVTINDRTGRYIESKNTKINTIGINSLDVARALPDSATSATFGHVSSGDGGDYIDPGSS